jgi:hypothetical protein
MTRIQIRIRFGLTPWTRIRIELKSWMPIRIETNADPKQWLTSDFFVYFSGIMAILVVIGNL